MSAYYSLLNREQHADGRVTAYYRSNIHAQGAWNPHEQHMAPATGLLCAELEQFQARENMRIGRISLDIFGLIAFGEFSITTRMIRAGKTIELIEAEMQANGKICIVARAWKMMTQDTSAISGLEDQGVEHPEKLPIWEGMKHWPGGFIQSTVTRSDDNQRRAGKGLVWINTDLDMVESQPTTDFVHLMGLIDTANGIVPRQQPTQGWAFPNLDLQIHLHRLPEGKWLGIEATQQFGSDGIGITSSTLHDIHGPFGRSEQILTLRKLASEA
ncbi:thioesterase [Acinetobacter sp. TTH0-4]|uniref:thioesterase family protein n=1 Tax=Acinetobacter sp. TTH0-4 TaxID=1646498 RepID=UPI0006AF0A11|nr:thioesterase family protein [Acinetobacter sp. TTH0-4]ALD01011.1 thioesterase [Acinetobacter sp. TTH0-4]